MREPARKFQDLIVWQKAHKFVLEVYRVTKTFPQFEVYGLTNQLCRSSVSIPANIAEGFVKKSNIEKGRFFNIAQGSLEETRYYQILAKDLGYSDTGSLLEQTEEISKLLASFCRSFLRTDT